MCGHWQMLKVVLCVATLTRNLGSATQAMTHRDATVGVLMDATMGKAVTANLLMEDNAIVIVKSQKTCMAIDFFF